jgi:hypothetical protein
MGLEAETWGSHRTATLAVRSCRDRLSASAPGLLALLVRPPYLCSSTR